ncbi:MAG: DUF3006 domain-containing protein [Clostridiales bacterium]|nr:DUF3006 domain-containing protein [Clostridiales bacterium]
MLIIDRIEEGFAVCELIIGNKEETMIIIERSKLPADVKAGDVLAKSKGEYIVDNEETKLRRERILKLQDSLWE